MLQSFIAFLFLANGDSLNSFKTEKSRIWLNLHFLMALKMIDSIED